MARLSHNIKDLEQTGPQLTFEQKLRKQIATFFDSPDCDTKEHRKLRKVMLSLLKERLAESAPTQIKKITDSRLRKANDPDRVKMEGGKITLYKQKGSRNWYFELKIEGEQTTFRETCKTSSLDKAREYAREAYYDKRALKRAGLDLRTPTFGKLADLYMRKLEKDLEANFISKQSFRQKKSGTSALRGFFTKFKIGSINEDTWQDFIISVKEKNFKQGSSYYGQLRQNMRQILQLAKVKHLYKADIPEFKLPRVDNDNRRSYFTIEEWQALQRFMDNYVSTAKGPNNFTSRRLIQLYCLIMVNTGMRTNDTLELRWRDITDLEKNGTKYISISVKGKKKPRTIIATDITRPLLKELETFYGKINKDDYVFRGPRGGQYKPTVRFKTMLKSANMLTDNQGQERTPYSMRHSYATWRLEEGMPIHQLATYLGTSVKMIEKHYSHIKISDFAHIFSKNFEIDSQNLKELGFAPIETDDEDDGEEAEV
ncbi:MAG: site-specific integrase [Rhodospirillaceae bacterium]